MSQVSSVQPVLVARDLGVSYGTRRVLEIPAIEVMPNRVLALIGPNGSGKTTLLLCLALLLKPVSGKILYRGREITDGAMVLRLRRRFAVAFQEPLLLNTTVGENVALGLRLRGIDSAEIKRRTGYWLERFGIASLAQRNARALSGGEAQRTSLARAFALQPEVLFLDEPFAALDSPTRQSLFGDVVNILQETRVTTVLVTHDRNEAQTLAHRIVMLMNGRIIQSGTPREIFSAPVNEEVARFVGIENVIEGKIVANRDGVVDIQVNGSIIEGISSARTGEFVDICIRPEHVTLSLVRSSTSARNVFLGKITSLLAAGALVRVSLDCGFPLVALITRLSADELNLEVGKQVFASFKATAIHIISVK